MKPMEEFDEFPLESDITVISNLVLSQRYHSNFLLSGTLFRAYNQKAYSHSHAS